MQKLPIGYFDGHSDGDMMSHFTNDTDTLRQMISKYSQFDDGCRHILLGFHCDVFH